MADVRATGALVPLRDAGDRRVVGYAAIDASSQWLRRFRWFRLTPDAPPVTFTHPAARGGPVTMAQVLLDIVGQEDVAAEYRSGDPLDNRVSNLRAVRAGAPAEAGPRRSAYRGVLWDPQGESWVAYGVAGGRYVDLGRFDDERAAATAAREWAVENQSIHLEDDHRAGGFGRALGPPRAPRDE
jgi:hypothetical protein